MSFGTPHLSRGMNIERKFVLGLMFVLGVLYVAISTLWHLRSSLIAPLIVVVGVGLLASTLAHYALFLPIRRLVAMARAVGAGDFSKRLGFERGDEIGSLAFEMNTMCDQLEAARGAAEAHIVALEQLRHSDRIATLGWLASSVAHELGNPLNVIELRAQLITSSELLGVERAHMNAEVIIEQARRMTQIIDQVLSFARMQPAQLTRLDLASILHKATSLTEHIAKRHGSSVQLDLHGARVELEGDADKLLQVIVNLIVNALQASRQGAVVCIRTSEVTRAPADDPQGERGAYVCVAVQDTGAGIASHLLSKVFEPFFSTRSAEGGTGLGLSVAQGIAKEHAGWIEVSSELAQGACFRVYLPGGVRSEGIVHASQATLHR